MRFLPVPIPTNQSFLKQWHAWILSKVSRNFKRDKERIPDAAQNVRLRLLTKDFVGRWFYKHLTDEVVDRGQAEAILGGTPVSFIGSLHPVSFGPNQSCKAKPCATPRGCVRSCSHSLWKVSDLLQFARFDYGRYYYSIQNHTIDSDSILKLLGYPAGDYGILESMYRQNRLKPSELTEHECVELVADAPAKSPTCAFVNQDNGERCKRKHFSRGYCTAHYGSHVLVTCPACVHGRELLRARGVSLAHRWTEPEVARAVARLRWNDKQLRPFLRSWRRTNVVKASPLYIMRPANKDGSVPGIDAGLLKYAEMVIDHEVVNDFKRIARGDDMSMMVFNKGLSPEFSDGETVAWESEDSEDPTARQRVFRDGSSLARVGEMESRRDLSVILSSAGLSEEEADVILHLDLQEMRAKDYAGLRGKTLQKVNRARASAMRKLRDHQFSNRSFDPMVEEAVTRVCDIHGCTREQLLGPDSVGPCVVARTDLFSHLFDHGMSVPDISSRFSVPEERVVAAINRQVLRDMRH